MFSISIWYHQANAFTSARFSDASIFWEGAYTVCVCRQTRKQRHRTRYISILSLILKVPFIKHIISDMAVSKSQDLKFVIHKEIPHPKKLFSLKNKDEILHFQFTLG